MFLTPGWRPVIAAVRRSVLLAELLLLSLLVGGAAALVVRGGLADSVEPLAGAAALTAAVVLALAGTADTDRRPLLIAAAVGPPAVLVLVSPLAHGRHQVWQLLGDLALLAVATLLAAAAGWSMSNGSSVRLLTLAVLGAVLVAMAGVVVSGIVERAWAPPAGSLLLADVLGRGGTAIAAASLVVRGSVAHRALLRRVGLAVVVMLCAPLLDAPAGAALTAAAAMFLLVAAAAELRPSRGAGSRTHPALRTSRLGTSRLSTTPPPIRLGPATPTIPSHPRREGSAQRHEPPATADVPGGERVAVASVVDDLAVLYRTIGLDVRVEMLGDPWASIDRGGLSELLANLLANCARHAPGARVRVRAAARGPRVRIEVIDDGPGLPPGSNARLLRRGVRGPGSTGEGLGLAICTELVDRYRGNFTVVSTSAGCTAVVELPTARRSVSAQAVSA